MNAAGMAMRHHRIGRLDQVGPVNRTVLMVEHKLSVRSNLRSHHGAHARRVLGKATTTRVSNHSEVREAYMGVGHA